MIYSIDGNIVSVDGNLTERKVNTLIYQVKGDVFPESQYGSPTGSEYFDFKSNSPNTVTINYGDGTVVLKEFEFDGSSYRVSYSYNSTVPVGHIEEHYFTNSTEEIRNISFQFEHPEYLTSVRIGYFRLYGSLPVEISSFPSVTEINYLRVRNVDSIPDSYPEKLEQYTVAEVGTSHLPQIPDTLFDKPIITIALSYTYDLSDIISSNFYKINQLKDTLTTINFTGCKITELPDSIIECNNLVHLNLKTNNFISIPSQVGDLINLDYLLLETNSSAILSIPVWFNCNKLKTMAFSIKNCVLSDIPNSWKYLYSLSTFLSFKGMIGNNSRFDQFIDAMYDLCTVNGSITNNNTNFGGVYPYRFRNISSGDGSISFTGAKVAPSGYVQGTSNGTPINQGEKAYVLQNQYGHTITHGVPII